MKYDYEDQKKPDLSNIEKFDEIFMANLSPRKSPDNRDDWMASWEKFKNA